MKTQVWRSILLVLILVMLLGPAYGTGRVLAGPVFVVNSTADLGVQNSPFNNGVCETATGSEVCSLRAAIIKANHFPGGGVTIQLPAQAAGSYYQLTLPSSGADDETTGDLNITQNLTIIGGGEASTVLDGGGLDRVLHIASGVIVTLQELTVQNGAISGASQSGAGILNEGTLTLLDVDVSDNTATGVSDLGNGIYSQGSLTLTRTEVHDNIGPADGGGIYVNNAAATVMASTIYGNATTGSGGGIVCSGCTLTLTNTVVDSNKALFGGGIYLLNSTGVVINRSALTNNWADYGGGVYNANATISLVNSTISGNSSNVDGGGICNCTANSFTHLYNVTIANNQADADLNGTGGGGGIANTGAGAATDFVDSIIALNHESVLAGSVNQATFGDCMGVVASNGYSILNAYNQATCTVNGSITLADPLIGPLKLNGGPTMTQAPLAGSPAIYAGSPTGCVDQNGAILTVDQRGLARPIGARCAVGSVEYAPYAVRLPLVAR